METHKVTNGQKLNISHQKHSGFGIASFVLSIFAIFLFFVCYTVLFSSLVPQFKVMVVSVGWLISASAIIGSVILGIVGLFKKNRKKLFSVLGIIISTLVILYYLL